MRFWSVPAESNLQNQTSVVCCARGMQTTGKKILLVEDDAIVVTIYRKKLEKEGFEVFVAEDGLTAMKQLPGLKPGLVVLDLMMPKFNGADVLKYIRSNKELKATKVIIFSNAYMTDLAQEAAGAGADRSLLKSNCTPAQLIGVIKELLADDPTVEASGQPLSPAVPAAATAGARLEPYRSATSNSIEAKTRAEFLSTASATLAGIRESFEAFAQAGQPHLQHLRLVDFHRRIHQLTGVAGVAACFRIAQLSSALEAMLFELQERPQNITPSVVQTIRFTADFLGQLFDRASQLLDHVPLKPTTLLVVDDDAICNRALVHALGRANLKSTSTDDPFAALKLAQETHYDLILLDYLMPGMDGLELCAKVRALPDYAGIPIIFITIAADFRERAQNILQQGDDVITKPIFPIELALKVLTRLMKSQIARGED